MLFKKIILLSLLIIVAEQLFYHCVLKKNLPAFWGNEEIEGKISYLEKHPEINTVFIGSSKVKTQILPFVFDSVTNGKTKSFNLGCNGLFIPESFDLLNYLLDKGNVKNILFEIRPVYHIYKENLHITRTTYYHSPGSYWATMQNTFHSNLPQVRKVNAYSTFTIAAMENLIDFNLADGYINMLSYDTQNLDNLYRSTRGCSLMGDGPQEALKNDHAELDNRAALSLQYMKQFKEDSLAGISCNKTYLKQMQQLIAKAKQKNIQLLLIFPSALRAFEYTEILPLLRELHGTPMYIMTDANEFPDLYKVENNYETDHLNRKGAEIYSVELGRKFNN